MADQEQPTKDSQRALPRNRRMRGLTHQPDTSPARVKVSSTEKRQREKAAGQRDMFDDPLPVEADEVRYTQPLLSGFLYLVDLSKNFLVTNRLKIVYSAA